MGCNLSRVSLHVSSWHGVLLTPQHPPLPCLGKQSEFSNSVFAKCIIFWFHHKFFRKGGLFCYKKGFCCKHMKTKAQRQLPSDLVGACASAGQGLPREGGTGAVRKPGKFPAWHPRQLPGVAAGGSRPDPLGALASCPPGGGTGRPPSTAGPPAPGRRGADPGGGARTWQGRAPAFGVRGKDGGHRVQRRCVCSEPRLGCRLAATTRGCAARPGLRVRSPVCVHP